MGDDANTVTPITSNKVDLSSKTGRSWVYPLMVVDRGDTVTTDRQAHQLDGGALLGPVVRTYRISQKPPEQ